MAQFLERHLEISLVFDTTSRQSTAAPHLGRVELTKIPEGTRELPQTISAAQSGLNGCGINGITGGLASVGWTGHANLAFVNGRRGTLDGTNHRRRGEVAMEIEPDVVLITYIGHIMGPGQADSRIARLRVTATGLVLDNE